MAKTRSGFGLSGFGPGCQFSFPNPDKNLNFLSPGPKVGGWNNEAFVHAPFDSVQEWISGFFKVSVETPTSPGGSSHESNEQGLRSSIHEQERDEIERQQEWISSFFEVSNEAPASPGGGSHESSEQGLRSSIQEQERNEMEFDER
ncbi:hypothetical protein WN943_003273 [Citrus x changshan-huyou]